MRPAQDVTGRSSGAETARARPGAGAIEGPRKSYTQHRQTNIKLDANWTCAVVLNLENGESNYLVKLKHVSSLCSILSAIEQL